MQFKLQPFQSLPAAQVFSITGSLTRSERALSLAYHLNGDLTEIVIPSVAKTSQRANNLWQSTCLECFLGYPESGQYWELNVSPSSHWNLYRFDTYRQGMRIETGVSAIPVMVQRDEQSCDILVELPLEPWAPAYVQLEISLCAVIELRSGLLSYWAMTHNDARPDFHRRDSFVLNV